MIATGVSPAKAVYSVLTAGVETGGEVAGVEAIGDIVTIACGMPESPPHAVTRSASVDGRRETYRCMIIPHLVGETVGSDNNKAVAP